VRTVTKEETVESFFNIFKSTVLTEEDEETIDKVELAYDVVRSIVDDVVPNSLEYYLGVREDGGADYGDEGDFDGDDHEGHDDDDDDDEEDKPPKKTKKQGGGEKKGPGAAGDQKPECKQQ